ncbi:class I SAM-dependent methyltransferase [Bernardetia sp.]|uniref:class I SAM-dependent methyltransferase n=1 Tax=Bernardetia sp. TaxID=1937974 RepID=UPI0025BCFC1D|nr:class I SAM-dependent methyltransferase [Bernardetia sp.]
MTLANIDFYRNIQIEKFKELAGVTGFDTGIDIDQIYPQIKDAKVIAELGVGYGRAIEELEKRGFEGKIYGVERVQAFVDYIQNEYDNENLSMLHQDIEELELPEKVDAVLWLWSGILEQNLEQQRDSICKIRKYLKTGGKLFIEAPQDKIKFVGMKINKHYIRVEMDWGTLDAYMPYEEDMHLIKESCHYKSLELIKYQSTTGLDRVFYVFEN